MDSSSSESECAGSKQPRKKLRRPETWDKNVNKRKKNAGEGYVSSKTKREVAARKVGPPCKCKKKCFESVGEGCIDSLFSDYYKLDYNGQSHYINSHVSSATVKRVRVKDKESRRRITYDYSVTVNNAKITVCKQAFLSIHGIKEDRVYCVLQKVADQGSGILLDDMRGRQEPHNKTSVEAKEFVSNFIDALPTCTSHYTRAKSPLRRYLPPGSTQVGLYKAYVDRINEKEMKHLLVTEYVFVNILHEYNIGIEPPRADTCNTCDAHRVKMETLVPGRDDDEITRMNLLKVPHDANAKAAHGFLKAFTKDQNNNISVITMDLQQTLPTPHLSSGAQYYKRKMWTFNFGIHDCKTKQGYFYVWNETVAKRGSNEVCSCIDHYVNTYISRYVKRLVIFSDNCSGQNKNINIVLMYLRLVHSNRFTQIEHYFMEPGHSYLPNDRDFGNFELFLKGKEVYTTENYVSLMRKCRSNNPFTVIEMLTEDFFFYGHLLKHSTKAEQSGSGFKKAKRFVVSDQDKTGVSVCAGFDDEINPPVHFKVQKGRSSQCDEAFNLGAVELPLLYPNGRPLGKDKTDDLKDLLRFIPASHKETYSKYWMTCQEERPEEVGGNHQGVQDPEDDFLDY